MGFPGSVVVRNPPASAGDSRDTVSIPESGRSPGAGNGNPLQYSCHPLRYSCLESPLDRVWWATVHRVAKSST